MTSRLDSATLYLLTDFTQPPLSRHMNQAEVLFFVQVSSQTTQDVFKSITLSDSSSPKTTAIAMTMEYVRKINKSLIADTAHYLQSTSVEDFMLFAKEQSQKSKNRLSYKLLVAPFKNLWISMTADLLGLNVDRLIELAQNNDQSYFDVGDAIILAGLYLICKANFLV